MSRIHPNTSQEHCEHSYCDRSLDNTQDPVQQAVDTMEKQGLIAPGLNPTTDDYVGAHSDTQAATPSLPEPAKTALAAPSVATPNSKNSVDAGAQEIIHLLQKINTKIQCSKELSGFMQTTDAQMLSEYATPAQIVILEQWIEQHCTNTNTHTDAFPLKEALAIYRWLLKTAIIQQQTKLKELIRAQYVDGEHHFTQTGIIELNQTIQLLQCLKNKEETYPLFTAKQEWNVLQSQIQTLEKNEQENSKDQDLLVLKKLWHFIGQQRLSLKSYPNMANIFKMQILGPAAQQMCTRLSLHISKKLSDMDHLRQYAFFADYERTNLAYIDPEADFETLAQYLGYLLNPASKDAYSLPDCIRVLNDCNQTPDPSLDLLLHRYKRQLIELQLQRLYDQTAVGTDNPTSTRVNIAIQKSPIGPSFKIEKQNEFKQLWLHLLSFKDLDFKQADLSKETLIRCWDYQRTLQSLMNTRRNIIKDQTASQKSIDALEQQILALDKQIEDLTINTKNYKDKENDLKRLKQQREKTAQTLRTLRCECHLAKEETAAFDAAWEEIKNNPNMIDACKKHQCSDPQLLIETLHRKLLNPPSLKKPSPTTQIMIGATSIHATLYQIQSLAQEQMQHQIEDSQEPNDNKKELQSIKQSIRRYFEHILKQASDMQSVLIKTKEHARLGAETNIGLLLESIGVALSLGQTKLGTQLIANLISFLQTLKTHQVMNLNDLKNYYTACAILLDERLPETESIILRASVTSQEPQNQKQPLKDLLSIKEQLKFLLSNGVEKTHPPLAKIIEQRQIYTINASKSQQISTFFELLDNSTQHFNQAFNQHAEEAKKHTKNAVKAMVPTSFDWMSMVSVVPYGLLKTDISNKEQSLKQRFQAFGQDIHHPINLSDLWARHEQHDIQQQQTRVLHIAIITRYLSLLIKKAIQTHQLEDVLWTLRNANTNEQKTQALNYFYSILAPQSEGLRLPISLQDPLQDSGLYFFDCLDQIPVMEQFRHYGRGLDNIEQYTQLIQRGQGEHAYSRTLQNAYQVVSNQYTHLTSSRFATGMRLLSFNFDLVVSALITHYVPLPSVAGTLEAGLSRLGLGAVDVLSSAGYGINALKMSLQWAQLGMRVSQLGANIAKTSPYLYHYLKNVANMGAGVALGKTLVGYTTQAYGVDSEQVRAAQFLSNLIVFSHVGQAAGLMGYAALKKGAGSIALMNGVEGLQTLNEHFNVDKPLLKEILSLLISYGFIPAVGTGQYIHQVKKTAQHHFGVILEQAHVPKNLQQRLEKTIATHMALDLAKTSKTPKDISAAFSAFKTDIEHLLNMTEKTSPTQDSFALAQAIMHTWALHLAHTYAAEPNILITELTTRLRNAFKYMGLEEAVSETLLDKALHGILTNHLKIPQKTQDPDTLKKFLHAFHLLISQQKELSSPIVNDPDALLVHLKTLVQAHTDTEHHHHTTLVPLTVTYQRYEQAHSAFRQATFPLNTPARALLAERIRATHTLLVKLQHAELGDASIHRLLQAHIDNDRFILHQSLTEYAQSEAFRQDLKQRFERVEQRLQDDLSAITHDVSPLAQKKRNLYIAQQRQIRTLKTQYLKVPPSSDTLPYLIALEYAHITEPNTTNEQGRLKAKIQAIKSICEQQGIEVPLDLIKLWFLGLSGREEVPIVQETSYQILNHNKEPVELKLYKTPKDPIGIKIIQHVSTGDGSSLEPGDYIIESIQTETITLKNKNNNRLYTVKIKTIANSSVIDTDTVNAQALVRAYCFKKETPTLDTQASANTPPHWYGSSNENKLNELLKEATPFIRKQIQSIDQSLKKDPHSERALFLRELLLDALSSQEFKVQKNNDLFASSLLSNLIVKLYWHQQNYERTAIFDRSHKMHQTLESLANRATLHAYWQSKQHTQEKTLAFLWSLYQNPHTQSLAIALTDKNTTHIGQLEYALATDLCMNIPVAYLPNIAPYLIQALKSPCPRESLYTLHYLISSGAIHQSLLTAPMIEALITATGALGTADNKLVLPLMKPAQATNAMHAYQALATNQYLHIHSIIQDPHLSVFKRALLLKELASRFAVMQPILYKKQQGLKISKEEENVVWYQLKRIEDFKHNIAQESDETLRSFTMMVGQDKQSAHIYKGGVKQFYDTSCGPTVVLVLLARERPSLALLYNKDPLAFLSMQYELMIKAGASFKPKTGKETAAFIDKQAYLEQQFFNIIAPALETMARTGLLTTQDQQVLLNARGKRNPSKEITQLMYGIFNKFQQFLGQKDSGSIKEYLKKLIQQLTTDLPSAEKNKYDANQFEGFLKAILVTPSESGSTGTSLDNYINPYTTEATGQYYQRTSLGSSMVEAHEGLFWPLDTGRYGLTSKLDMMGHLAMNGYPIPLGLKYVDNKGNVQLMGHMLLLVGAAPLRHQEGPHQGEPVVDLKGHSVMLFKIYDPDSGHTIEIPDTELLNPQFTTRFNLSPPGFTGYIGSIFTPTQAVHMPINPLPRGTLGIPAASPGTYVGPATPLIK